MKMITRIIGMSVFVVLLAGITWLSSEVYSTALHIGTYGVVAIHSTIVVFWTVFLFSFFSGENIFGKHLKLVYELCNILFGVLFYLFLGSVLLSVLFFIFPTISILTAWIVVIVSLLLSILGLIQARHITETHYSVHLPYAPASWHGKKAVFLSDTHFGLINHRKFSNMIVDRILSLKPSIVFHGGDFYDGPLIDTEPITASWKRLTDIIPVFYTSGNHEMYGPYDTFIQSLRDAGVTVLLDEKVMHDGVEIAGLTYRAKGQDKKAREVFDKLSFEANTDTILINHPPTFHSSAESSGATVMLSGHTHRGQFSPIGLLTWLIYKKYNYGINTTPKMTSITSRGVGTAGPPMRLFNTPELVVITFTTQK
jgi:predicted MPP superfamily phosphohydrolase